MTRAPRILAVAWAFSDWQHGGEPIGAYELVSHLARLGAEVDVVTALAPIQEPPPPGVRIFVAPGANARRPGNTGRNKAAMVAQAQRLASAKRYDVLHVVTQFTSFPPILRPLVMSGCHNVDAGHLSQSGRAGRLKIFLRTIAREGAREAARDLGYAMRHERAGGWTLDRTIREADLIIVRERVGVAAYEGRARRVEYVPFGVNPGPERPRARPRDGSVLFVGRLEEDKGVHVLLEAFAQVAGAHPATRLKIVGKGREQERLHALADRLGLAQRVDWLGHVPRAALRPLYESASAFVLASLGESFGQVNLEAMAAGTPVVTTDMVAGALDYLEDGRNGLRVPAADASALAAAIGRLLSDEASVERMGARARKTALAYDWRSEAQRHLELFRTLPTRPGSQ